MIEEKPPNDDNAAEAQGVWPLSFCIENFADDYPNLEFDDDSIEKWVYSKKKILVRAVTWNLAGLPPPDDEHALSNVLPGNRCHLYVIGTEECERSIAQSAVNPSKKVWESYLTKYLGPRYVPLRSHTLQATHIIVFAHQGIAHLCHNISSTCVACGIGNTLGNKGGVSIRLEVGKTSLLFINSHLAAHQNAVSQRNQDVHTISRGILANYGIPIDTGIITYPPPPASPRPSDVGDPSIPSNAESASVNTNAPASADEASNSETLSNNPNPNPNPTPSTSERKNILESCADRIIFMGDMNYRILGTRSLVDTLLKRNMHEVMIKNDQLNISREQGLVFQNFVEPPLNFRPTYKLDTDSDQYDTSSKQRIPAWTDRILHSKTGVECTAYDADFSLRTSDHRPVYASFNISVGFDDHHIDEASRRKESESAPEFESKSQVCSIT